MSDTSTDILAVTPFNDPLIQTAFERFPNDVRPHLLALREQIFANAARLENCGALGEVLKWGQPSYQTRQPKSGTPIRLGIPKSTAGHYALYVHCQTNLIETIRACYANDFEYDGNRALIMQKHQTYSRPMLDHVISMALLYHHSRSNPE